jgi:hypothetical protein
MVFIGLPTMGRVGGLVAMGLRRQPCGTTRRLHRPGWCTPAGPARGQSFFTTTHGREWSCASCHGTVPTQTGKHASTGKPIGAMAPAFNPERFTDAAKTEKWFRRNCNDVLGRTCTAAEKADVLAWLMTLKP